MTLSTWGASPPSPAVTPAIPPVRLLIVAQPGHAQAFYAAFAADARFAVQAVATSADDARAKLTLEPEAVIVEVVVFSGPPEFANTFAAYRGAAFAIVPANLGASLADAVRQVPCVLRVAEGEPNLAASAGEIYAAVVARRPAAGTPADSFTGSRGLGVAMIGWRAIAVWSPQGGVGKSTVALALALEALARRLPTLLVGLAAPDMTPLILEGILPEPNILTWRAAPTVDGLRSAVQVHRKTGLHILVGFRDPVALGSYEAQEGPSALTNLAYTAAQAGYGILILDVSAPEIAPAALSAAMAASRSRCSIFSWASRLRISSSLKPVCPPPGRACNAANLPCSACTFIVDLRRLWFDRQCRCGASATESMAPPAAIWSQGKEHIIWIRLTRQHSSPSTRVWNARSTRK